MELNELQKALLWFEQNGFECKEDDGSIYLILEGGFMEVQISTSEILFRAELWDSNN
jgi:hypothetical protein